MKGGNMEGSNIAEITETQYTLQVRKLYLLANMIVAMTLKKVSPYIFQVILLFCSLSCKSYQ